MSYDEFFRNVDMFSNFMKRIYRMLNGGLKSKLEINQKDRPSVKGYVIQGSFGPEPLEPFDPFNPFEPFNPLRRRPVPKRPFEIPGSVLKEAFKPLIDVFEEKKTIKIYMELPGEKKDEIQLNITAGRVEVKAKNFYKMIKLPTINIDLEKASSTYKNGVLEVIIPKKEKNLEEDTLKINLE